MNIIGITGTIGAGKGTIVEFLIEKSGYKHYSARSFIAREVEKRDMEVNRDSLREVANDIRKNNSPSYIIDELYKEALAEAKNSVIESIRTPGEVDSLRGKEGFILFAVDADPKLRFERIKVRGSETDNVDFETFIQNEKDENDNEDPNKQNLAKCISMADFVFENNSTIKDLYKEVEKVITELNK